MDNKMQASIRENYAALLNSITDLDTPFLTAITKSPSFFGGDISKVKEIVKRVNSAYDMSGFEFTRDAEVDADQWETLVDRLAPFVDYPKRSLPKDTSVEGQFLIHMLEAFGRGERFIVAKLSYDGGK